MNSNKSVLFIIGLFLFSCADQPAEEIVADENSVLEHLPMSCDALADANFSNTNISSVESVAAGAFLPPAGGFPGFGPDYSNLPGFCRVVGSIHPTDDSDIRFELWLPTENWNGRFMQTGNGGVAGSVVHSSLADPLLRGYAVANTDTGHTSDGNDIWGWAVEHPEKLTDYAWRAVHELTMTGKAITNARYASEPEKSYFVGCSTGGRQGLMEAQRFPNDYDAIVAGAPANNWSSLMALSIVIQTNLGEGKLAPTKLGLLKETAIASCDALDGVEDRVITNIAQCSFDPASLECDSGDNAQCLTPSEVEAAQVMYAGVRGSSGNIWFPGTGPASEPLWAAYASPQFSLGTGFFRDVLLDDSEWDPYSFNADELMSMAVEESVDLIAMDPDISSFIDNGGKLITYHGTTDGLISYGNSVNYIDSLVETLGEDVMNEAVRFYLVPGMDHCAGGEGAHAIEWLTAMESWVEEGNAPDVLVGTHPQLPAGAPGAENSVEFTRPTCPYPEVVVYNGSGDVTLAENFSCRIN
jgi:feruloyl esterase